MRTLEAKLTMANIKGKKIRPTSKQMKLLTKITENTSQPMGKLMREVGYSKETSKQPSRILKGLPFRDVFTASISDKLILKAHKKLLTAKIRTRTFVKGDLKTEIVTEDAFALSKGVELAYRVKGAFAPVESKLTITGLEGKSDDEIEEMLRDEERALSRVKEFKSVKGRKKPKIIEGEIVQP